MRESDFPSVLTIHASAVYTKKGALLFLGPSETGKSTICGLLAPYVQQLADDAVYLIAQPTKRWEVFKADGQAYNGIPGRNVLLDSKGIPLYAVFRLYQAATPYLVLIDSLGCCRYLTNAFFEIPGQRHCDTKTKCQIYSSLANIARAVPGYEFHFTRSVQTYHVLNQQIEL